MSTASAIAVSGMNAAALRLQVSARNIANSLSGATVPAQGIEAGTSPAKSSIVQLALPDPVSANQITGAFRTNPYSVLSTDMVQQLIARFDLVADAHVISADATMQATVLYQSA